MENQYAYHCPHCSRECSVAESLTGQTVDCPHCSQAFYATPPDQNSVVIVPEKLPFFKSSRKKILKERLQALVQDGEMSSDDEALLGKTASLLGLEKTDLDEITKTEFLREFDRIKRDMESTWYYSDENMAQIEALKVKYGVENFTMDGPTWKFRQIYLLEVKGEFPQPVCCNLTLSGTEVAYNSVPSIWHQTRVQNRGYSGTSVSIPTGIRGVRFRFGQYNPIRSEVMTPLASGMLWATSKRLIFHGDKRSVNIDYKKIIDAHIFSDALQIEKASGKPDLFSMQALDARYFTALIGTLR